MIFCYNIYIFNDHKNTRDINQNLGKAHSIILYVLIIIAGFNDG